MIKNYFFLKLILCFLIGNINAQNTAIPDANFEQALIDLNIDSDGIINESVATADISSVTSLSVNNKNISDLTGIEDFSSLTFLSCASNSLTTLNVTENVALSVLICRNNYLSNLDVSQNTNLYLLHCFNNRLTSLNVTQNTSLSDLKCYNNQLTELDVTLNTGLNVLNCSDNQIENLDVTQNTQLTNLVCSNNLITELNISQNTWINNLSCSNNLITSLDVSQLLGLVNLYCNDNQLVNLVMGQNTVLSTFYSFNNQISDLDLSQCPSITNLNCNENQLTQIDVSLNTSLLYFRCNNNELTVLNVRNGLNSQIAIFDAQNNTSLDCIQVDDETAANDSQAPYTNWLKDASATYAEDCGYLGLKSEALEDTITLYPNPVTNILTIDSTVELIKVEIYSSLGTKVKVIYSGFDALSMNELSSGIYIIRLESEYGFVSKQLVKK